MKHMKHLLVIAAAAVLAACGGGNATSTALTSAVPAAKQGTRDGFSSSQYRELGKVKVPASLASVQVQYTALDVNFNPKLHIPNSVSYVLTAAMVAQCDAPGAEKRENYNFERDSQVKGCPEFWDYKRTGYDRGHMAPAMDMRFSPETMAECFLMTNMVPQVHDLNEGEWNSMEIALHRWARALGALVIVTGPVPGASLGTIGQSYDITVPARLFKAVLDPQRNMAIAFVFDNAAGQTNWRRHAMSVDELEQLTGYDLFAALPDEVEQAAESRASLAQWESAAKANKKQRKRSYR